MLAFVKRSWFRGALSTGLAGLFWLGAAGHLTAAGTGTTSASFLRIGTSARSVAMGEAVTGWIDDVDAIHWNPAGLAMLQRSSVSLTHLEWFEGIRYDVLSYADKFDYIGALGVSVGYLYFGDIPKTLETASGDYDLNASLGTFSSSDMAITLAWAGHVFGRDSNLGFSVKIIQETIDSMQAFSMAVDIANQWWLSYSDWYQPAREASWLAHFIPASWGISARNLGTDVQFTNQKDPLPMSMQLGVGFLEFDEDLVVGLDLAYQAAQGVMTWQTGVEYWLHPAWGGDNPLPLDIALRAGYRSGFDDTSAAGISLGAGVQYAAVGLDYVFMPYGELGLVHRVTLKFAWGDILQEKAAQGKRLPEEGGPEDASEAVLEITAEEMVHSKLNMEDQNEIQKNPTATLPGVSAKRPDTTLGAVPLENAKSSSVAKTQTIQRVTTSKSSLIDQITRGARTSTLPRANAAQYLARSPEDAARAARTEAEIKGKAFQEVEDAALAASKASGHSATKVFMYFAKDSDSLPDDQLGELDKVAKAFEKDAQFTIMVHGFAAADEDNKTSLSVKRAKAVKDYLVQMKSIPGQKIFVKGLGDKEPVATNDTEAGRNKNRRVRVQIITTGN